MKFSDASEYMNLGHFDQIVCAESGRVFRRSKKGFFLVEVALDGSYTLGPEREAVLTEQEQRSDRWGSYRPTVSPSWFDRLRSGQVVLEDRGEYRFAHRNKDGVVWTAKLDGNEVGVDSIRNWFPNWEFTKIFFGGYIDG